MMTEMKTEIADHLPDGSSAEDVVAWLAAKGIEHSGLIDNADLAHMGADPATLEIKAILRSGDRPALVRSDTQITFVFDRDRTLINSSVRAVHTGL